MHMYIYIHIYIHPKYRFDHWWIWTLRRRPAVNFRYFWMALLYDGIHHQPSGKWGIWLWILENWPTKMAFLSPTLCFFVFSFVAITWKNMKNTLELGWFDEVRSRFRHHVQIVWRSPAFSTRANCPHTWQGIPISQRLHISINQSLKSPDSDHQGSNHHLLHLRLEGRRWDGAWVFAWCDRTKK